MAIASPALRFKLLDKETNVPVLDFRKLTDNEAYNNVLKTANTAADSIKEADKFIKGVSNSISELKDLVMKASDSVMSAVRGALDQAMNFIESLELPNIVKDIFNSIKELDTGGVKEFVKELLHVGSSLLCNNLDFLKLFMLGFAINKNIIAGLLSALLLSWLDRYCKGFTKKEFQKKNNLQKVEAMFPQTGPKTSDKTIFNDFSKQYSDYLEATKPLDSVTPVSQAEFMSGIKSGNISATMDNLRSAEISSQDKKNYMTGINSAIATANQASTEMANLLKAKGTLAGLPLISVQRRDVNIKHSNLSDQLSGFVRNATKVDMSKVNTFELSAAQASLAGKIKELQTNASKNVDLMTRSNEIGANSDFDFSKIMPTMEPDQYALIKETGGTGLSHKPHDLHPTTSLFL